MEDRNRLLQEELQRQAEEEEQALQEDWSVFPDMDTEEFAAGISDRKARERILQEPDYREAQLLLFKASAMGDGDLAELALARGANPNIAFHGNTPLHYAAAAASPTHAGDTSAMKVLLKAGANPNTRNNRGETPLHVAAWSGNPSGIHMLLDAGADPTLKDKMGRTPIELAHRRGMTEACQILGTAMINRRQISMKDYNLALRLMPKPPEMAKKAVSRGVSAGLGGVCLFVAMAASGCSGNVTDVSYHGSTGYPDEIYVVQRPDPVEKVYELKVATFEDPFQNLGVRDYQPKLFWNRDGIVIEELSGIEGRDLGEFLAARDTLLQNYVDSFVEVEIGIGDINTSSCVAENTSAGQDPEFLGSHPVLTGDQDFRVRNAVRGDTWWDLARKHNVTLDSLARLNAFGSRTKSRILAGKLSVGEKMWFVSGNTGDRLSIEFCDTQFSKKDDPLRDNVISILPETPSDDDSLNLSADTDSEITLAEISEIPGSDLSQDKQVDAALDLGEFNYREKDFIRIQDLDKSETLPIIATIQQNVGRDEAPNYPYIFLVRDRDNHSVVTGIARDSESGKTARTWNRN